MKTAREVAHEIAGCDDDYNLLPAYVPKRHRSICNRMTEAIEADRASHAAELREAVDLLRGVRAAGATGNPVPLGAIDAWLARNPGGEG